SSNCALSWRRISIACVSCSTSGIAWRYTLSLYAALPICAGVRDMRLPAHRWRSRGTGLRHLRQRDGGSRWQGGQRELRLRCPLRSEEHTSELQSRENLVCRLLLEKKKDKAKPHDEMEDTR